jgi:hypothetical protein
MCIVLISLFQPGNITILIIIPPLSPQSHFSGLG